MRPCASPLGISWWMMPLPAVIHWTSPARQRAAIAEAVAVIDRAREHVGDGLDAAMRMPGEAGEIFVGVVVAEIVEQEERIELLRVAEPEAALQFDSGPFERGLRPQDPLDGSY